MRFKLPGSIGITAGASTADETIDEVITQLKLVT
jgi:4-hydroxy-3-methylbut-2-enyl diphosphate reductase IspH